MADNPAGASPADPTTATSPIVVVSRGVPSLSSPDPRERQIYRRIMLLSRLTGGNVRLLALETTPTADRRQLAAAGIEVTEAWTDPQAALRHAVAAARAIWLTDALGGLWLADTAGDHGLATPLLLDIDHLPSTAAAAGRRPLGRNSDGLDTLVKRWETREAALLAIADRIICSDETQAADIARRTGTRVEVVGPTVVRTDHERPLVQRRGAVHYGRWTSEPGHPDEDGFHVLLDSLGDSRTLDTVLSQDTEPRLRAGIPGHIEVAPPHDWVRRLRTARFAVLPRRFGLPATAAVAELCAQSTPFLTTAGALAGTGAADLVEEVDLGAPAEWGRRVEEVASDAGRWESIRAAVDRTATTWLDHDAHVLQLRDILDDLGIGVDLDADSGDPVAPEAELPAAPPPPITDGTLRAGADMQEYEVTLLGNRLMSRHVSLEAQGTFHPDEGYDLWRAGHLEMEADRARLDAAAERFGVRPTVSILLPTFDADPVLLAEAIESVREQTWPMWQLCIVDDASPDDRSRRVVEQACRADDRIVARFLAENLGIAGATNEALASATGEYVGFLDHDDVLRPAALHWIVDLLNRQPDLDVIYTDEDRLDPDGDTVWPFFKPDWSPDLLLSVNYITHFTVVRRSLLHEVGGLRTGFDGSQDHDLLLRVTERTDAVGHVAKPLYSWRQVEGSTSAESLAKPEAHAAGQRAIEEALARRGMEAVVRPGLVPNWHWVRHRPAAEPLVSIVVPTRDRVDLLAPCIDQARSTAGYDNVEFVVVDNQSDDPATLAWLDAFARSGDGKVVRYPHRFSFARQVNLAAVEASGSVLLLLNNDTRPTTNDWLRELLGHALRPEIGAVGARLLWPDGRPQHEGIVLNVGDAVAWNISGPGQPAYTRNTRDTAAVTGACLMTRRTVFDAVGGLDEQLRVAFNDVDYCLRVGELGYRVVYTPWAELVHSESSSRGSLHPDDDEDFYRRRWGPPDTIRDPFYNVNLDMADPVRFRI